jgi:hypothetical protein
MGTRSSEFQWVPYGQCALKEPGCVVFQEGSSIPGFPTWDSGQQERRLTEGGIRRDAGETIA